MDLTIGMKGTASTLVERSDTALEVGSGDLLVYATPCMAALMEGAACEAIAPALEEGQTSVGIALDLALSSCWHTCLAAPCHRQRCVHSGEW